MRFILGTVLFWGLVEATTEPQFSTTTTTISSAPITSSMTTSIAPTTSNNATPTSYQTTTGPGTTSAPSPTSATPNSTTTFLSASSQSNVVATTVNTSSSNTTVATSPAANSTGVASNSNTTTSSSNSTSIASNSTAISSNSTMTNSTSSGNMTSTSVDGNSTLSNNNSTSNMNSTSSSNSTTSSNSTLLSNSTILNNSTLFSNSTSNSTSIKVNSTVVLKICPPGSISDPTGSVCVACSAEALNCVWSGTTTVATLCKPPFILSNGLCVYVPSCPANALDCGGSFTSTTPAFSCIAGYALVSGTTCVACYTGTYALAGSTNCAACDSLGVSTCSQFTGDATACMPGYNLTLGSCASLNNTNNITSTLRSALQNATVKIVLPCKVGQVRIENSADGCVACPVGSYQCSGTWPSNITINSCQNGQSFSNGTCSACPVGQGSVRGNIDPLCTKCRNPAAVQCAIGSSPAKSFDLSCKSGFYLKKGICGTCPPATSTIYNNKDRSCTKCPGKGTKRCNLDVSPVLITACVPTYKYSNLNNVGICTFIKPTAKH